jgi:hypothetical protein
MVAESLVELLALLAELAAALVALAAALLVFTVAAAGLALLLLRACIAVAA